MALAPYSRGISVNGAGLKITFSSRASPSPAWAPIFAGGASFAAGGVSAFSLSSGEIVFMRSSIISLFLRVGRSATPRLLARARKAAIVFFSSSCRFIFPLPIERFLAAVWADPPLRLEKLSARRADIRRGGAAIRADEKVDMDRPVALSAKAFESIFHFGHPRDLFQ